MMGWFRRREQSETRQRKIYAAALRAFDAAAADRLLAGWKWDGGWTAGEIAGQLSTIRARSREMAKNSPYLKRFIQLCETNIVGEGFRLRSEPVDFLPDGSMRPDTNAARFVERHFWRWATTRDENGRTYCDATGRLTLDEIDRLNVRTLARDGEYFTIIEDADNPYGVTLRLVRPDACDERFTRKLPNGNTITMGVEQDETGRIVGYWFRSRNGGEMIADDGRTMRRVPAERVIHVFRHEEECQLRGVPWAHAILAKLKALEEYDKAELAAARDEACKHRTIYAPRGQEDEIADLTAPESADAVRALMQDIEPAQTTILPLGWQEKIEVPAHPNREVTEYKKSLLRDIATGLGVEYACFANDWAGVSYSSVRQGTIAERDAWIVAQSEIIARDKSRVFLAWLHAFLLSDVSGGFTIERYQKLAEHSWRGRRWTWVDPMRDLKAAMIARTFGWKTDSQIAEELGQDFEDNVATIRRENEIIAGTRLSGAKPTEEIKDEA